MRPKILYCLLILFPLKICFAQPYYFKHYQVENGLSNNTVYCSAQDKQGFLWFGTKDGLNRFDGYSFKTFRHDGSNKKSIGNNFIQTLYLDRQGILWIGTAAGIYHYNAQDESFIPIKTASAIEVRSIVKDSRDNCWFIGNNTVFTYQKSEQKLISYKPYQHFDATSIAITATGEIWVSSTTGTLEKLDPATKTFAPVNVFEHSKKVASNYIEKIFAAGDQKIFVGTSTQGFKIFDAKNSTYQDVLTYNKNKTEIFVRDFLRYNDHEYWIATESGIFIYNTQNNSFINLNKQYNDPYSLSDNAVYTLFKDSEDGVWAGTYFGGLNYYPKQYATFNKFYPQTDKNALLGNVVREICKDKYGNLWVGTEDNGLNKLNAAQKTWTHYNPGGKNSLSNTNIQGLLADGENLFVGTFDRGLDIMNIASGKIVRHFLTGPQSNKLKSNFVICYLKTKSGLVLVGTSRGLYTYNPHNHDFSITENRLAHDFITSLTADEQGTVWVGTMHNGVHCFNPKNNQHTQKYAIKEALKNTTVNDVFEDSRHQLWFATEGVGLWLFDPQKNSCKKFDSSSGLPANFIFRIEEDDRKNLWISTTRGLMSLNLISHNLKIYTKANGLLSDQFNYNSSFKDADGTLYFGCVKGMVSFNPNTFQSNRFTAPVYITGLQVFNKEIMVNHSPLLSKSILYTHKINLKYDQSSFSIDFAALDFASPEMTQYKYKMKGLDNRWTFLKTNRKIYFTQLLPGHYTFMLNAANNEGRWNNQKTRLEIEISPPFWASVYAYLVYTILFLLAFFYVVRRYHRRTREKNNRLIELLENDKEKQIYNAKIEFFTNVAHEIRTPLTLIKGPMEKVIKRSELVPDIQNNLKIMEKNTNRLLDLTNQLLDFRKTETNTFNLTFVKKNIHELLEDLFISFKPIAEQKKLSYTLKHPAEILFAYIDNEALNKILSNLFNNAVKYADKNVEIELLPFTADSCTFCVEIRNDGHIIPQEMSEKIFEPFFRLKETEKHVGTGIGLSLSRSLAELHKGFLALKEPDNQLNIFTLTLPIHQEKEFNLYPDEEPEITPSDQLNINISTMKPSILLVDDNPEILDFIADGLTEKYTVNQAQSGAEALKFLELENPDLIISDVMMPGIDGFELCRKIKTDFDHSHIPVILLTAKNTLQSKITGLEVGADAYVEKPFSPEYLEVQIANLLINRSKIKEHFANSPLAHIKSMAYSQSDEAFLETLNAIIYKNIQNPDMDVELVANQLNMSKPTLYRKIKAISSLTINELINITRLKVAAKLLEEGHYKIYEVADMVGYSSQSHLGRNFLKQFGTTPTEYQQSKKTKV
ncbi:MAG: hybrid sensor histidine kinase/response regulator [Sphingobacteriaceae bacterium]|nr:MAG: hybrid sensor histidine kinase/response regulator [Sphingobacteriaceae bacterium]